MPGYTKLFERILDSTVWRENDPTRILWITLLALADKNGNVFCTIPGLADRARITLIDCEKALERFQSPDKYSWSQEDEGRRIRPIVGGWFLINHEKFRNMMSREEQKEKTRLRVREWRKKQKLSQGVTVTKSNACNDKHLQIQLQKQKQIQNPGGVVVPNSSEKSAPPPKYTQNDFNERDLRRLAAAENTLAQHIKAAIGAENQITEQEFLEQACEIAGITVQRALKLKQEQKKWPKS